MNRQDFMNCVISSGGNPMIANMIYEEIHPQSVLKVKRTEDAKQFPLLAVKKDGDVGYDLVAVLPYKKEFEDRDVRNGYIESLDDHVPRSVIEREMRQSIVIPPSYVDEAGEPVYGRGVIPTGISLELPRGHWASIEARSSTSKVMITVPKGVIDEGYRGELFAVLLNVGPKPVEIFHGDRYVQLIVHERKSADMKIMEVDTLTPSERGDSGFGSTGQNG